MKRCAMVFLIPVVATLGACSSPVPGGDACLRADRPVTLSTLMENSLNDVYEMCLTKVRAEAIAAVEN